MALSKEFYLEEIKSKYPNSYNESLKDLPVKDLEDMLDFLDQALGKADGGAIGIEVLFTDKKPRKNFSNGGDSDKNTKEFQNKYIQAAIKLASDKNIGIGDAMMITSDEDFDIDSMEYKGSSKGILEILNQKADGGRVGLFMGGPALEGQALNIYNSMNAYGFSDQEIADALSARGLYNVAPAVETSVTNTAPNIINQGGGEGSTPPGPKTFDKGFSSLNFGLGKDIVNKDAVVDYEAEAYNVGPTFTGTFARALTGLKNIPTPFNIARMGIQKAIDFAKQKEKEKEAQLAAIARDIARDNKAAGTGGYQSSFGQDTGFMEGKGTAAEMGSFKRGGLATMFTRRR